MAKVPPRRGRGRRWLLASLASLALAPAACGKSESLAEIDTPVAAALIHETRKTVGGSGNHFVCSPRVITSHSLELSVDKRRITLPEAPDAGRPAELVADERGTRLAYRLGDAPWRIVYVGAKQLLPGSDSLLIRAPRVDFAKVPLLEQAGPVIYRESPALRPELFAEFRGLGKEPLVALLAATLDTDATPKDLWEQTFKELDPEAQKRLRVALHQAVGARASQAVLLRMARVAPIDAPPLARAALAAVEASDPRDYGVASVVLAQASAVDPALAAARGCAWLSDARRKDDQTAALLGVAADKTACPGLAATVAALDPCARELRCGDPPRHDSPLCSAGDARELSRRALQKIASWDGAAQASLDAARAWAALAHAATDARLPLANARRAYKPLMAGESCEIAEREAEPCRCDAAALAEAACSATPEKSGAIENCSFVVDDTGRQIRDVRSRFQARATTIFAGSDLGCAILLGDGSVECWGDGMSSMPGTDANRTPSAAVDANAAFIRSAQRRRIPGVKRAIAGSAGRGSACAVVDGGDVYCWGALGTGGKTARKVLSDAVSVGLGDSHACAVLSSGEVECWGHNYAGQLGTTARELDFTNEPLRVSGVSGAESLACAQFHCCARTRERRLACWGGHANVPDAKYLNAEIVEGALEVQSFDVWAGGGCASLKFGGIACWKQQQHPRAARAIEAVTSAAAFGVLEKGIVALVDGKATFHPRSGPALPMPLDQPLGALAVSNASVLPQIYALTDDGRIARLALPAAAH